MVLAYRVTIGCDFGTGQALNLVDDGSVTQRHV